MRRARSDDRTLPLWPAAAGLTLAQAIAVAALSAGVQLELIETHEPVYAPLAEVTLRAPSKDRLRASVDHTHLEYVVPTPPVNVTITPLTGHLSLGHITVSQTPTEPVQLSLAL
ncbi:MAG TPA: hypothetical protein VMT66_12190 [Steroidobacteraceae bacterium]|nr:hypothetical protein [Steroidobacteraceae bacterium]